MDAKTLRRVAEAKRLLSDIGKANAKSIATHLGYDEDIVVEILDDPVFQDLYEMYMRGQFALWAGVLADEQEELSKLIARLGYKAALRLDHLLDSQDEKIANQAIRTALEYNSELERPVVRHEITSRFTTEELEKAREVVRRLRASTPQPTYDIVHIPKPDESIN
jgi:hypothetical protein